MTKHPSSNSLESLRRAVRGRVWLPGDSGFDESRRPWNLAIDQAAVAVVEAAHANDVAALIRYAADAGLAISTQPTGHGATGAVEGTIVLRTGRFDHVEIDAERRRARIGAGIKSGQLQEAAAPYGLTGLPGSSPVVSVAGVALGGGLSWFGRAFGWVADCVVAFDALDAKGEQHRVTAESDPDLFWALRGGGGEFAIVTGLELNLHPAPDLFGGRVLWDAARASAVVDAFRSITDHAANELTVWLELLQFPGADPMVAIDSAFIGKEADARRLMAELDRLPEPLSDDRRVLQASELGSITAEPTTPSPGVSHAELLTDLGDSATAALLKDPIAPVMVVQVRHLGGALGRDSDSPHGPLTEPFAVYMYAALPDPNATYSIKAKQREIVASLPTSGRKPATFLTPSESLDDAFDPEVIERLRWIKADRDPGGVLRGNFPIPR